MKKFTKIALSALSLASVAAISIAGTVAYLTNTDADINVMTLGNVKIEQHEYERVTNADGTFKTDTIDEQNSYVLQDFTQGKALVPIVGDPSLSGTDPAYAGWDTTTVRMSQVDSYGGMQVFAGKNAQDKFVTVENTGKTDAYVRTLVAVECGSTDGSLVGTSHHSTWTKNKIGTITVGGVNYYLVEYVYEGASGVRHENGVLPAGDTSYPNLSQVYIKSAATNEDMVALDGNGNGTLDVLVLSQAVQAEGFDNADAALDAAFGADIAANAPAWFADALNIVSVGSTAEVLEAIENGATYIDANGANIDKLSATFDQDVIIANAKVTGRSYGNDANGTVSFVNCTFENTAGAYSIHFDGGDGDVVFTNCTMSGWISFGSVQSVTMNNCTLNGNGTYSLVRFYQDAVLNNCVIDCTNANTTDEWPEGVSAVEGAVVELNNCTLTGANFEVEDAKILVDGTVVAE